MIDQLISELKSSIGGELKTKHGLNEDQANEAVQLAAESTGEAMAEEFKSGGLGTIANLFSNKQNSKSADALQSLITSKYTSKLINKLGLPQGTVTAVVSAVIPKIISFITKKNDETPEGDNSVFQSLAEKGGALSGLSKLF